MLNQNHSIKNKMNCRINPKELYRPLHSVADRKTTKRGVMQRKLKSFVFRGNFKSGSPREKVPVSRSPGLIIKVCMSSRPYSFDTLDRYQSKTPDEQAKRPMTSCFMIKDLGCNKNFGGLERIKFRCKSISSRPCETKDCQRRRILKAVIPKVENLQGWND